VAQLRSVGLRAEAPAFVLVIVIVVVTLLVVSVESPGRSGKAVPFVVASSIQISRDFTDCSIQFVNEGNATDTVRSVLIFYTPAGSRDAVVRNANPAPSIMILPSGTASWDCAPSLSGSPPGINGEVVHVVISAVISRERDSVGYFT